MKLFSLLADLQPPRLRISISGKISFDIYVLIDNANIVIKMILTFYAFEVRIRLKFGNRKYVHIDTKYCQIKSRSVLKGQLWPWLVYFIAQFNEFRSLPFISALQNAT